MRIKVCSIKQSFYKMFDNKIELEKNEKRPCLVIVKLKYRGVNCNFAIPFRSNIYGGASRCEYYPLPPRKTTKEGNKHGLHYTKMFPIKAEYVNKYYAQNEENENDVLKIEKNIKTIVNEAQQYLKDYENGIKYKYCTKIEIIFNRIYKYEQQIALAEVASTKVED